MRVCGGGPGPPAGRGAAPPPRKGFHPLTLFAIGLVDSLWGIRACKYKGRKFVGLVARALVRICEQAHRVLTSPRLAFSLAAVRGGDLLRRPTGITRDWWWGLRLFCCGFWRKGRGPPAGRGAAPPPRKGFHPLTLFAIGLVDSLWGIRACKYKGRKFVGLVARALVRICEQAHRVLTSPRLAFSLAAVRGGDLLRRPTGLTRDW